MIAIRSLARRRAAACSDEPFSPPSAEDFDHETATGCASMLLLAGAPAGDLRAGAAPSPRRWNRSRLARIRRVSRLSLSALPLSRLIGPCPSLSQRAGA